MEDERLAVSLVSELAEERVPCRETRTGLEKSASGITGAVRKTRNSSGRRATGRTISRAASDLNLASNLADETTVMPTVPSESCVLANRKGNATRRRKWTRHMNRDSARRYCTVVGHYSRSSQPAALTENSASGIYSDPS